MHELLGFLCGIHDNARSPIIHLQDLPALNASFLVWTHLILPKYFDTLDPIMMFMLVGNLGLLQSRGISVVISLITSDHCLRTHNITQQSACVLFLILRFTESYTKLYHDLPDT